MATNQQPPNETGFLEEPLGRVDLGQPGSDGTAIVKTRLDGDAPRIVSCIIHHPDGVESGLIRDLNGQGRKEEVAS